MLYDKITFMVHAITVCFCCYHKLLVFNYHSRCFNELIKLRFGDFIIKIKRYSICVISFFSLHELFSAYICINNTGSLVNSLFGDKNLIPTPSFTSSHSSGGMDGTSSISPFFITF